MPILNSYENFLSRRSAPNDKLAMALIPFAIAGRFIRHCHGESVGDSSVLAKFISTSAPPESESPVAWRGYV